MVRGQVKGSSTGVFNPTFVHNGYNHFLVRADEVEGRGSILHFRLGNDALSIDDYIGVAVRPSDNPVDYDSISCEDGRSYLWKNPVENRDELYLVYVGHSGKFREDLRGAPPDTRLMLAVSYDSDLKHFQKLGPLFDDGLPDKDGAIINIAEDGSVLAARRPMVGKKWITYIMSAPNIKGPYTVVGMIPSIYDWMGDRNGASQFVHIPGVGYVGMVHGAKEFNDSFLYSSGGVLLDEGGRLNALVQEADIAPLFEDEVQGIHGKRIALCSGLALIGEGPDAVLRMYSGRGDFSVGATDVPLRPYLNYLRSYANRISLPPPNPTLEKNLEFVPSTSL